MIRQATSADIAAIAATYEDLLTYEQEHGGDSPVSYTHLTLPTIA